ncbi:IclR-like helix-turn-helix domain-containing protein [Streptomyces sp. T12]|uniref:helix-turn-helix domain-containing protein n=1 Tax=Streptomyces sp. T12 TaxID=477697 RepID=UPI0011A9C505|nr:helix-turn-helix domain-containing protein [Streptomyces sp. T12]TWD13589.1 IclR-like helix-turn-helix domain-containing protein [Streptomyces sp. T12]
MTGQSDAARPHIPQSDPRTGPASVIASAFALLRVLSEAQRPVGVTSLASAVGLPKTTAHRLLEQMAAEGVVERRERKWRLGNGIYDLARLGHPSALAAAAHRRLEVMSNATGATLFLHHYSNHTLQAVSHAYGTHVKGLVSPTEQTIAARHPASAIWQALKTGQLAAEYRQVRPECDCIAVPFSVAGGDIAVLSLARPAGSDIESLKRPLERAAALIRSDLRGSAG